MPDAEGKLTPDELKDRWKTSPGKEFHKEIIRQLQDEGKPHWVICMNLDITVDDITYSWIDFLGVSELVQEEKNVGDLRGIDLSVTHLEGADLCYSHLEGTNFRGAHLEGADLHCAHLEGVDFRGTHLEGANFLDAHLERADLRGAHLDGTDFRDIRFEGADFRGTHLKFAYFMGAYLIGAQLEGANLWRAHLEGANLREARLEGADLRETSVRFKSYRFRIFETWILFKWWLSRILHIKIKKNEMSLIMWDRLENLYKKYNPTRLNGAQLKNVKLDGEPVYYRDLLDEQYLDDFAEKHRIMYLFWLITSNCGRCVLLLFFWTLVAGVGFGLVFADISSPGWLWEPFRDVLAFFDPEFSYSGGPQTTLWQPFYLSFVTMTTLGVASAEPANAAAYWWHTAQNLTGYLLLGYLIAVLGSKLTRRSA